LKTSSPENMKQPSSERSVDDGDLGIEPEMSSSISALGSRTLYWSCAKKSARTLWPSLMVPLVGSS
jgi:hypothetical protein